ncbi:MAG: ribose 5-phosphate isomerase B [Porcipelethomonas sp.]
MIVIGSDHAGYDLKAEIIAHLTENGMEVLDAGCNGESCDYPEIAVRVTSHITNGECDKGILVCGTGVGMSMAANKVNGIRAALCGDYFSAKYTRLHNDANVLCLGARTIGPGLAMEIADVFLNTEFEGGRHQRRIDMFKEIEKNNK